MTNKKVPSSPWVDMSPSPEYVWKNLTPMQWKGGYMPGSDKTPTDYVTKKQKGISGIDPYLESLIRGN